MVRKEQSHSMIRNSKWDKFKKKLYARIAYNALARVHSKTTNQLKMLNLGIAVEDQLKPALKAEDESERLQFQLYYILLNKLDIAGKHVLEIGCGVGGGCYYMQEYFKPARITGIDLIKRHIVLANQYFGNRDIKFIAADACEYTMSPASVDVVVDLESSHLYPDFARYVQRTYQVLKPGGYFTFADMRVVEHFDELERIFSIQGFNLIYQKDISDQVQQSIDQNQQRIGFILGHVPFGNLLFRNFSFSHGSAYYEAFKRREWIFKHYILQKPF